MKPTPILFYSDSPNLPTGLARITKDLATQTCTLPQFRVGTFGRGGQYSAQIPCAQYNFNEEGQWGENHIEEVWDNFSRGETGVIMTVWDVSRLGWFARPVGLGNARLEKFLTSKRFAKWAYVPVDSYGVGGRLTGQAREILKGFDRVLAYTLFGKQLLEDALGHEVDWIPHGYNSDVWRPRGKAAGRAALGLRDSDVVVGCMMTNQARKDWGCAMECIAHLKDRIGPNLRMWAHVDVVSRYWNMFALIDDFGLADTVRLTFNSQYTSEQLSYLYSACDVTMLPSLGEGWGFPLTESMACGIPVIHTAYGGGAEQLPIRDWLVEPTGLRLDGLWNCYRPIWSVRDWADKTEKLIGEAAGGTLEDTCTRAVQHLRWQNLWPSTWRKWLLTGIRQ